MSRRKEQRRKASKKIHINKNSDDNGHNNYCVRNHNDKKGRKNLKKTFILFVSNILLEL